MIAKLASFGIKIEILHIAFTAGVLVGALLGVALTMVMVANVLDANGLHVTRQLIHAATGGLR
jgi:hypothetical protein